MATVLLLKQFAVAFLKLLCERRIKLGIVMWLKLYTHQEQCGGWHEEAEGRALAVVFKDQS